MYSLGSSERVWPFTDGLEVGWEVDRMLVGELLLTRGQRWDSQLGRWLAKLPGVSFPVLAGEEHERAAEAARVLLA